VNGTQDDVIRLLFLVEPLLRRKLADAESLVAEAEAEAVYVQTAGAMAGAESVHRSTQLTRGNGAYEDDGDEGYGKRDLFQHLTVPFRRLTGDWLHAKKRRGFSNVAASRQKS
jgi:hypothetical protein